MRAQSSAYHDIWKKFKTRLLRQISYFKKMSQEALDETQFYMAEEFFQQGSLICGEREVCECVFFIVEGQA